MRVVRRAARRSVLLAVRRAHPGARRSHAAHFAVHTVAHDLLHFDGALWRTLQLLFVHPGRLSLEYSAGRRRPYVNPFRLLLIAIVAYALISSSGFVVTWNLAPVTTSIAPLVVRRSLSVEETIRLVDPYGLLRQQMAAKRETLASEVARERLHDRLGEFAEPVSFTMLYCSPQRRISPSGGNDAASSSTSPSACTPSASSCCRA